MPGQKPQIFQSHRYVVTPKDRLHRRRFPFYFEQTNYSFRISVERVDDEFRWVRYHSVKVAIRLENDDFIESDLELPDLPIGQRAELDFDDVYVAHPGQTSIVIPSGGYTDKKPAHWLTLYSYRVRTQESLWVSVGAILFGLASLSASIVVPICTANLRRAPIVQGPIINNIVAVDSPSPTPIPPP